MTSTTPLKFRAVPDLRYPHPTTGQRRAWRGDSAMVVISTGFFSVPEAAALRDWLNTALPVELAQPVALAQPAESPQEPVQAPQDPSYASERARIAEAVLLKLVEHGGLQAREFVQAYTFDAVAIAERFLYHLGRQEKKPSTKT